MKILSSMPVKILNFTSEKINNLSDDCRNFGNDYIDGAAIREALRSRMLSKILPDYSSDIYKNSKLQDVYIPNFADIGNNSYKGATLAMNLKYLDTLKNSGVNTVIDLEGYRALENACKEKNIDYYCYKVGNDFWQNPIFHSNSELIADKILELSKKSFTTKEFENEMILYKKEITKQRREFMDKFIDLTKKLNEGSFYISCQYGEYRTPNILALNSRFNPKWSGKKCELEDKFLADFFDNMANNLTKEDKEKLGIKSPKQ